MLRICENCIHNEVCNEWAVTSGIPFVSANTCENFMTADVVPKSEVDKIFEEIESKIIAEIDRNNGVLVEFEDADELYHRIKGEVYALCEIQDFSAELKKKYTEEQE